MPPFCHLHCHTQYSLLDGAARISRLVEKASELEMSALAITDHGNLFGVPEFYTKTKKKGISPIIGCEFYVTPTSMGDRNNRTRFHQVLLVKNEIGYRNLIRLSSLSYTEGYYYKPRIDHAILRAHSEGLIATTCCLQGEVLQAILKQGEESARKIFEMYLEIFEDDYYIEIQNHNIPDQQRCNEVLLRWSAEYDVSLVATNDVHYVEREDAAAQDVLLCLQTGKDLADPNRMRFENDQFFLKSSSEMEFALRDLNNDQIRGAIENTSIIADKCHLELPMGKLLMPHYPLPTGFENDVDGYLRHLTFERAGIRFPELTQVIQDRLNHELDIVQEMGYAGYFLIVQDFTTAARDLGVRVGPGRGSAAGSLIAYCLGITNIDPIKYELLFERFLNPERISMPDIDIDFDDRGRSKVIDYVVQKYGRENVCQIITFGTMGARSVIRDVSRVLGIPLPDADRIAKLIPEGPGVTLESAFEDVPEFRKLLNDPDERIRNLLRYAKVLEGSARHTGVHAAGVIIAPGNVSNYVPVSISRGKGGADDVLMTQYDGKWVESFGLLKMDFLGLKTLSVINDTVELIDELRGIEVDLDTIPMDDALTFELFQKADTIGIFQFESSGMREWLHKLQPTTMDDLIAMNALYRPGPMDNIPGYIARKHGEEEVSYPHEMLEPILKSTYGIPVYQEQVMQMAQVMAGYTLGGADILRRAMGKKIKSEMVKQRSIFVAGASENGVDETTANKVFDLMAKFAGYGFNKSHAAAYSIIAYQTAYLKAHFPAEFLAAAMTNDMSDIKKLSVILEDTRHLGISLLPPSVNKSQGHFTVENGQIRFGLCAIKGAGTNAIENIVSVREDNGRYDSLFELTERIDSRIVNKKAIESLARAGALDELDGHRAQLVEAVDAAIQYGHKLQADHLAGKLSLFGDAGGDGAAALEPRLPEIEPWSQSRILREERDTIGVYVSGHPLEDFLPEVQAFASAQIIDGPELVKDSAQDGNGSGYWSKKTQHTFCGIITEVNHRTNKSGRPYAFCQFEDFSGHADLICFSNSYDKVQQYLKVDEIVLIKGSVELRGSQLKVLASDVIPMWKVRSKMVKSLILRIDAERFSDVELEALSKLLENNRGGCKLVFELISRDAPAPQRILSRTKVIDPTDDLMKGIRKIFGPRAVMVEGES